MLNNILEMIDDMTLSECKGRYTNCNGILIPSVTEILGFFDNEGLINWANGIGLQGIDNKNILRAAANYGTASHDLIERILKGETIRDNPSTLLFRQWWNDMNNKYNTVKILGMEERMCNNYYGGTYDLLLEVDGSVVLVDFKTSKSIKYKYFMQMAAYQGLLQSTKNITVNEIIILHLNKHLRYYGEYKLLLNTPNDNNFITMCNNNFLSMVYSYYTTDHIKQLFDQQFK